MGFSIFFIPNFGFVPVGAFTIGCEFWLSNIGLLVLSPPIFGFEIRLGFEPRFMIESCFGIAFNGFTSRDTSPDP